MAIKRIFLKDGVVEYYLDCKSIYKTAEHFNYKVISLYRLLKENGVNTKMDREKQSKKLRRYEINEDYFGNINTRDKAYILGIISSDGHLTKVRKQLRIKLTDIDLLEDICKRMNYKKPLLWRKKYKKIHKDSKELIICNIKIYDDLIKAGIQQNKSYRNIFPDLERRLLPDFIRGFFDGNGSITIGRNYLGNPVAEAQITSSLIFCNKFQRILKSFKIDSVVSHNKRHDIRIAQIRIRNISSVIRFFYLMYRNAECQIFLKRKKEKYSLFIAERKNNIGSNHQGVIRFETINTNIV